MKDETLPNKNHVIRSLYILLYMLLYFFLSPPPTLPSVILLCVLDMLASILSAPHSIESQNVRACESQAEKRGMKKKKKQKTKGEKEKKTDEETVTYFPAFCRSRFRIGRIPIATAKSYRVHRQFAGLGGVYLLLLRNWAIPSAYCRAAGRTDRQQREKKRTNWSRIVSQTRDRWRRLKSSPPRK